jgi:hypothetical protein
VNGLTLFQAGTYWWTAAYSGDTANNPVASGCGDESVTIAKASPTITTRPGGGGPPGTGTNDTANLAGGSSPTGTIEFKLYGPSPTPDCTGTPIDDETFTVNGNGTYGIVNGLTLFQAGTYWWTAAYSGDTANNPVASGCGDEKVTVTPGAATSLVVALPSTATAGTPVDMTVTAEDAYGNVVPGYTGTVHFTSSDPGAVLPADYTFTAADHGTHTFTGGVTFGTTGTQSVTATDTITASITGTSGPVTVS